VSWSQEIDLRDLGVQLPTHGQWVDVPGSPFQVKTQATDMVGTFSVRIRPTYGCYWMEFISTKEAD
jgi:hypothetical protein